MSMRKRDSKGIVKSKFVTSVDPDFLCVFLLDWRDSLLICEKTIFSLKVGVATYFYLFLKGKSSKNKTPRMTPNFWKSCFQKTQV